MIGTADYSIKMDIPQALTIAVVGLLTVITILAVIAVSIIVISKVVRFIENKTSQKKEASAPQEQEAALTQQGEPLPESKSIGSLELVGTDEATAAIIMAIISDKSGIPLNRLVFKSIRLLEDK